MESYNAIKEVGEVSRVELTLDNALPMNVYVGGEPPEIVREEGKPTRLLFPPSVRLLIDGKSISSLTLGYGDAKF